MNVIQTSTLGASARALVGAVVLWCSAAMGAPPPKLRPPPETEQRALRARVEQQQGGGFFYFAGALLTLGATGLGLQAIRNKQPQDSWLLRSPWRARLSGGVFGIFVGSAFVLVCGSPNGRVAGAVWLVAVFGVCAGQLAFPVTKAADRKSPPNESPRL
jgi:hypothetical protein